MKHKCDGCEHKALHQEGNFRPFGVCLKEPDLIRGEEAFLMKVCPHKATEMTETEIMKALECCAAYNYDNCAECPLNECSDCDWRLPNLAIDIINRKNAEIEMLKGWERLLKAESHAPIIKTARAEAIKEFAEKAEKRICEKVNAPTPTESWIVEKCIEVIDQIAKEMGVEL